MWKFLNRYYVYICFNHLVLYKILYSLDITNSSKNNVKMSTLFLKMSLERNIYEIFYLNSIKVLFVSYWLISTKISLKKIFISMVSMETKHGLQLKKHHFWKKKWMKLLLMTRKKRWFFSDRLSNSLLSIIFFSFEKNKKQNGVISLSREKFAVDILRKLKVMKK